MALVHRRSSLRPFAAFGKLSTPTCRSVNFLRTRWCDAPIFPGEHCDVPLLQLTDAESVGPTSSVRRGHPGFVRRGHPGGFLARDDGRRSLAQPSAWPGGRSTLSRRTEADFPEPARVTVRRLHAVARQRGGIGPSPFQEVVVSSTARPGSAAVATGVDDARLVGLRRWNLALTVLHTAQAVAVLLLASSFAITVTSSFPSGPPGTAVPAPGPLVDVG